MICLDESLRGETLIDIRLAFDPREDMSRLKILPRRACYWSWTEICWY